MSQEENGGIERGTLVNDEVNKPFLETLVFKNGPKGYTVEIKRKNSYFSKCFDSNSNQQENSQNIYQDPEIDSTNPDEDSEGVGIFVGDNEEFDFPRKDSFSMNLVDLICTPPSFVGIAENFLNSEDDHNLEFQLVNPSDVTQSLKEKYLKTDCMIGGISRNVSELEDLRVLNSNHETNLNLNMSLEEPLFTLERLFSNVSDVSQASTRTVTSFTSTEENLDYWMESDEDENSNSQKNLNSDGDIFLPVIYKTDSNIFVVKNEEI